MAIPKFYVKISILKNSKILIQHKKAPIFLLQRLSPVILTILLILLNLSMWKQTQKMIERTKKELFKFYLQRVKNNQLQYCQTPRAYKKYLKGFQTGRGHP